ncbi:hypothetical protein HN011_011510 [Eciton burchellii]|nr:hypothetical protein HN011_011510 [Eciton burchellii]
MNSDPTLQVTLTNDNVQWHFILPAAPHFGGLWEAGVKNFKFHLQRVIGSRTLSKAEFATLLCQIEACLNSRPIATLSDDPNDLSTLMPNHFLIGRPLISIPEESVLELMLIGCHDGNSCKLYRNRFGALGRRITCTHCKFGINGQNHPQISKSTI